MDPFGIVILAAIAIGAGALGVKRLRHYRLVTQSRRSLSLYSGRGFKFIVRVRTRDGRQHWFESVLAGELIRSGLELVAPRDENGKRSLDPKRLPKTIDHDELYLGVTVNEWSVQKGSGQGRYTEQYLECDFRLVDSEGVIVAQGEFEKEVLDGSGNKHAEVLMICIAVGLKAYKERVLERGLETDI